MTKGALLLAAACCAAGCMTVRDRNAPGIVDVRKRPAHPESREPEVPGDPGTQMVRFAVRALAGGGLDLGGARAARGSYGAGFEANLSYGRDRRTNADLLHRQFLTVLPDNLLSETALGVTAGWTPGLEGPQRAYVEAEYQGLGLPFLRGISAGYVWEPSSAAHGGPQATLWFTVLYLRGSYLSGRGTSAQLGLELYSLWYASAWSK
jgi:hypothetical protein